MTIFICSSHGDGDFSPLQPKTSLTFELILACKYFQSTEGNEERNKQSKLEKVKHS